MSRPDTAYGGMTLTDAQAERELLLTHLRSKLVPVNAAPEDRYWLEEVRGGAFHAIPATLSYNDASALGHLVHGYALLERLGRGDPDGFLAERLRAARRKGTWAGTALELWVTLFLQYRADRMAGSTSGDDIPLLDELVAALRSSLLAGQTLSSP